MLATSFDRRIWQERQRSSSDASKLIRRRWSPSFLRLTWKASHVWACRTLWQRHRRTAMAHSPYSSAVRHQPSGREPHDYRQPKEYSQPTAPPARRLAQASTWVPIRLRSWAIFRAHPHPTLSSTDPRQVRQQSTLAVEPALSLHWELRFGSKDQKWAVGPIASLLPPRTAGVGHLAADEQQ